MSTYEIIGLIIVVIECIYVSYLYLKKYKEYKAPSKDLGNGTWGVVEIKPDSFWKYLNHRW